MAALNEENSNDPNRFPFGEHFDDVQTDQIFYRFLGAYVRVCSFLLLVDVHLLSQPRKDEIYPLPLISHKHIRYLHNIIRSDKAPVFHVLHREHGVDVQDLLNRLHKDFLKAHGASNLFQLTDKIFHKVSPDVQNLYAQFAAPLLSALGWTIFELPGASIYMDRSEFHSGVLAFFEMYSEDLQDASKPIDAGVARDLIQYYSTLVHELCQWDDSISAKLVDKVLDFGDPDSPTNTSSAADLTGRSVNDYLQSPTCFPALIMNAWKFKILRKYIVKGNMGLRVMSIATMDAALVEIWREYSGVDPTCKHPVMQYLADFLLKGQVVDYIVSVDSHPQLISRSGNIVGFLVVTHRWSDRQADAIWKTVATSPDPRVVAATMTMLRGIIGLMRHSDRLYLCTKLHDLPIERYTLDILRFLRDLTLRPGEPSLSIDEGRGPTARPWNVCIRMVRDTAPGRDADTNLLDLHSEAIDQLRVWINMIPVTERHVIFRESAQQISSRTTTATGNFKVNCMLMQLPYHADTSFFQQHHDLMRSVLEEIPAFIRDEAQRGSYSCRMQALHYRLDFLRVTLSHSGVDVPNDLFQDLWDHIIGKAALSNEARDLAWTQLLHAIKASPDNKFCKQLVNCYISTLDAKHYTPGLYDFIASYIFPITRVAVDTEQGSQDLLQIPGASLLWPIILSAPHGTIEDRAANLLAARYVQIVDMDGILFSEVEDAHKALVEKCMKELRAAIKALTKQRREETVTDIVNAAHDASAQQNAEVRIGRILMFQRTLLDFVRRKAQFNRGKRVDSKVEVMEVDNPSGDAMIIKYQCGNDRQCVTMASDHSLDDLYRKLCHAAGYTKVNLFARGQRLNLLHDGAKKLFDFDFGGQVIVQRADGAESTRLSPPPTSGSSVLENAIVEHFDELFTWMDSDDTTSASVSCLALSFRILLTMASYSPF
jgi:ubiquitin carboxyl-terminal hydrolase 34